jgi:hypothetical protein
VKESERKWKKVKESERKWKKVKESERKWKKVKESERKWNNKENNHKPSDIPFTSKVPSIKILLSSSGNRTSHWHPQRFGLSNEIHLPTSVPKKEPLYSTDVNVLSNISM